MPNRCRKASVHPIVAVAGLVGLGLGWPHPSRAEYASAADPWSWVRPQDQALTGGIARLRSPGSRMVRLPRGEFWMGSTVEEIARVAADCALGSGVRLNDDPAREPCNEQVLGAELPRHRVRLSAFWLDRTEVTVADYQQCVARKRCAPSPSLPRPCSRRTSTR